MEYILDTHTHTIASGHAYNTFLENAREASKKGIKLLGTTDHGPAMPGGPHLLYFSNLKALPREVFGVKLLRGCEANIMDYEGNLDIHDELLERLDIVIASLHDVCIRSGSRAENTRAIINAMNNRYVDIIGHSGNPAFPIYEEEVVKVAKERDVLIEINNSSLLGVTRVGSIENCYKIAALCKDYGVKMIVGSDAHTCFHIGNFEKAKELIENTEIGEELVMNSNEMRLLTYLKNKGKVKEL